MKKPRWNYVNGVITWAIASAGFAYTQWQHTTTSQTITVFIACLLAVSLANLGINAVRTRNPPR